MTSENVRYEGQAALDQLVPLEGKIIGMQHSTASEPNNAVVFKDPMNGGFSLAYLCQCDPEHCNQMAAVKPLIGRGFPILEQIAGNHVLIYHMSQGGLPGSMLEEYRSLLEDDS